MAREVESADRRLQALKNKAKELHDRAERLRFDAVLPSDAKMDTDNQASQRRLRSAIWKFIRTR